jgi:hypothetical protein
MSAVNIAAIFCAGTDLNPIHDDLLGAGTTQAGATPIRQRVSRVIGGAGNSGLVLPAIGTGEATISPYWVINDGPNTIKVYCALGEKMNTSLNASLSLTAGQTGVFIPVGNQIAAAANAPLDWKSAAIS